MKSLIMVGFTIKTIVKYFVKLRKKILLLQMKKAIILIEKLQTVNVRQQKIGGQLILINGN